MSQKHSPIAKRFASAAIISLLSVLPVCADADTEKEGHHITAHWSKTLSKNQWEQANAMHHKLEDDQAPFKTREAQTLTELNTLIVRGDVSLSEIHKKIDELINAKREIMRLRYDHLVEMRRVLNAEQRVSYDEAVMKRYEVK
mgnify:FL=1|tara:strand:- start:1558 stop:1986 length:429 start_codon:yes stop_codon:yes gene_type:complete